MSSNPGDEPRSNPDLDYAPGPGSVPPGGPSQTPMPPGQYAGPTQPWNPVAPPPKSRRGEFIRLGILLAIAIAIGAGFFLFRDRLSNDVASLQPGECFDRPAAGTLVTDVQRQPCNEPHDAEVFANVTHTAAPGASYPPSTEFDDLAGDECLPTIQSYSGLNIEQLIARNLDYGYFYPSAEGWGDGDRVVTCYATSAGDIKLTGSIRNAGTAPPSP